LNRINLKILLPLATLLTLLIGSAANSFINSDAWYQNLIKSSLNPPSFLFGIVWPILYILMGTVSYFKAREIYNLYLLQLLLNAIWSWIFFYFHQIELAFLDIILLIFINLLIVYKLLKDRNFLFVVMYTPYILWLIFASFLNYQIMILN
tara:strand:+ start:27154 stop:27603 length:450 start_codon:yes stop_codon:yes gene_type:complete